MFGTSENVLLFTKQTLIIMNPKCTPQKSSVRHFIYYMILRRSHYIHLGQNLVLICIVTFKQQIKSKFLPLVYFHLFQAVKRTNNCQRDIFPSWILRQHNKFPTKSGSDVLYGWPLNCGPLQNELIVSCLNMDLEEWKDNIEGFVVDEMTMRSHDESQDRSCL